MREGRIGTAEALQVGLVGDGRIERRACGLGVGGFFYGVMCLRTWAAISPAGRGQMPCGICLINF